MLPPLKNTAIARQSAAVDIPALSAVVFASQRDVSSGFSSQRSTDFNESSASGLCGGRLQLSHTGGGPFHGLPGREFMSPERDGVLI